MPKAERSLRNLYNQRVSESKNPVDPSGLDAVRRQLLLAEKIALTDAVRKKIVADVVADKRLQQIDEKLLGLEDD